MNNMWKSDKQIQNELLEENSSLRKQLKQYNSLEGKLKDLLISTYEKVGDKIQSPGRQRLTPEQIVEEIKNDTEIGIQYYKGIIGLTTELLMKDKIHMDEEENKKLINY
jgi:glutathionylspermidine synthase